MPKSARHTLNCQIMARVQKVLDEHPDWRFHQALQNCGASLRGIDEWYEEPEDTLARMDEASPTNEEKADG